MKKIYSLAILLLTHYICLSQAKNYFVDGSRWVYQTNESYEPGMTCLEYITEQNLILGDTVINAISYKKVFANRQVSIQECGPYSGVSYDSSAGRYLRYDSLTERVYFLESATSTEKLIYDFNLIAGDSLPAAYRDNYIPDGTFEGGLNGGMGQSGATIDSIGTIILFGSPARIFYIHQGSGDNPGENYIIEGVGGYNGFYYDNPVVVVVSGGFYITILTCFQSGDSVYTQYGGGSCPYLSIPTGINSLQQSDLSIILSPNPATTQLTIHSSFYNEAATVSIMNVMGQVAQSYSLSFGEGRGEALDISALSAGMYFLQLKTESGRMVKRFVKE